MSPLPASPTASYLDAVPGLLLAFSSVFMQVVLPHCGPQHLIVDRWRHYLMVAIATILLWLVLGYVVVHLAGRTRPLMLLLTLSGLLMLPVGLSPLLGWLNANMDRGAEAVAALRVSGYAGNRGKVVAVRLHSTELPELEADKMRFFPGPLPAEGTAFRGVYHRGALGTRWLSAIEPMVASNPQDFHKKE